MGKNKNNKRITFVEILVFVILLALTFLLMYLQIVVAGTD